MNIKDEVAVRVNRLGSNEYRLAVSRAQDKNNANEIVELIGQH